MKTLSFSDIKCVFGLHRYIGIRTPYIVRICLNCGCPEGYG